MSTLPPGLNDGDVRVVEAALALFLTSFNRGIRERARNFVKEAEADADEVGLTFTRSIRFKHRRTDRGWDVFAERGLLFKKRYPLFSLGIRDGKSLAFEGLYTEGMASVPLTGKPLTEALDAYAERCYAVPSDAFMSGSA